MALETGDPLNRATTSIEDSASKRTWLVSLTSFIFIVLQSACTAVIAVSGIRVAIGLSALAASLGIHAPTHGFHQNAIRIPMMIVALVGSLVNLYVIWRIRSLRARPSSQWRVQPATVKQKRSELIQIALAIVTLALVASEWILHPMIHQVP
jgi:fumarate reductase subunit C